MEDSCHTGGVEEDADAIKAEGVGGAVEGIQETEREHVGGERWASSGDGSGGSTESAESAERGVELTEESQGGGWRRGESPEVALDSQPCVVLPPSHGPSAPPDKAR